MDTKQILRKLLIESEITRAADTNKQEEAFFQKDFKQILRQLLESEYPKELEPLAIEARKYNSVEEFIKWWDKGGSRKFADPPYIRIIMQEIYKRLPVPFWEVDKMPTFKARKIMRDANIQFLTDFYNQAIKSTRS